jgi:hypothetical protein
MSLGMNSTIEGRFAGCEEMQRRGHERIAAEQLIGPERRERVL